LVEVALALGIMAFALLSILALLPIGVKSNQISAEEARAVNLLGLLEADLRNTHPSANAGKSLLFGLSLPYGVSSSGDYQWAVTAKTSSLQSGINTAGLDEGERVVPLTGTERARYQASVIYTVVPAPGSLEVLQARLVVNWPSVPNPSMADLTDPSKVRGWVETLVNFPSP
jgi:hypothetical protein